MKTKNWIKCMLGIVGCWLIVTFLIAVFGKGEMTIIAVVILLFIICYICAFPLLIIHLAKCIKRGDRLLEEIIEPVKVGGNWFSGLLLIFLIFFNPIFAIIYLLVCLGDRK